VDASGPLAWSYSYSGDQLTRVCDPTAACTTYTSGPGSHYRSAVLDSAPYSYWRLNGSSAPWAQPRMIVDATGRGGGGTWSGSSFASAAGLVSGGGGTAMTFDGRADEIDTGYRQTSVTAYSAEAWIQTTDAGSSRAIVQDRGSSGGKSLTLGLDVFAANVPGTPYFTLDSGGILIGIWSPTPINDGRPHHLVGTWSGAPGAAVVPSQFRLYVDGAAVATNQFVYGSDTAPLTGLGGTRIARHDAWNTYLKGTLDEIAVYEKALPAARVQAHYTAGTGYRSAVLADTPAAYYPLDERAGTSEVDLNQGRDGATFWALGQGPGALAGTGDSAATFDGSTSVVGLPDDLMRRHTYLAIELWFKTTAAGPGVLWSAPLRTGISRPRSPSTPAAGSTACFGSPARRPWSAGSRSTTAPGTTSCCPAPAAPSTSTWTAPRSAA
jgi:hypothetical protein